MKSLRPSSKLSIVSLAYLILILASFTAVAQYDHIRFKSDLEKKVLTGDKKGNDLDFLMVISQDVSQKRIEEVKQLLDDFKSELIRRKFSSKSEEKRLKLLFELAHKGFFEKYIEVSNFNRIFTSGEYNCVSATALYCLMLDEFGIPYTIKETPSHVYAIAYPFTKNIVLESTAPRGGYMSPGEGEIQKSVNALVEAKIYTSEEVKARGKEQIYQEFFYNQDDINLRQLAGLQYYNEVVTFLQKDNLPEALNANYKAEILYPTERNQFINLAILSEILAKSDFSKTDDIAYFSQYANNPLVPSDEVFSEYTAISGKLLFDKDDTALCQEYYRYLKSHIKNEILLTQLSLIQFEGFSKYHFFKGNFSKALVYAKKAYEINPDNVKIQAVMIDCIAEELSRKGSGASLLQKMDDYTANFPFLLENSRFLSAYFNVIAYMAGNHFRADDLQGGMKYLNRLTEMTEKEGQEVMYNENLYGFVYAEAGAAYYRKRQYQSAKEIIEKGLAIMPDHPELKVRLQIVDDEL